MTEAVRGQPCIVSRLCAVPGVWHAATAVTGRLSHDLTVALTDVAAASVVHSCKSSRDAMLSWCPGLRSLHVAVGSTDSKRSQHFDHRTLRHLNICSYSSDGISCSSCTSRNSSYRNLHCSVYASSHQSHASPTHANHFAAC